MNSNLLSLEADKYWKEHIQSLIFLAQQGAKSCEFVAEKFDYIQADVVAKVKAEQEFLADFYQKTIRLGTSSYRGFEPHFALTAKHYTSQFNALDFFSETLEQELTLKDIQETRVMKSGFDDDKNCVIWKECSTSERSGFPVWKVSLSEPMTTETTEKTDG